MNEVAIGIDLGTTFSAVAYLDSSGRPRSLPNSEGDLLTPSVVFFDGSTVIVGKEAIKAAVIEPERLAQFAKRDMGSPVYSKTINGEHLPPEVIQSLILEKLKRDAEQKLGPVSKVVITVPAYFNEPRRKATQDAGQLAKLDVLDIINEPTAAAIAYGVEQGFLTADGESRQKETILVYDLGGGTFDVTLMELSGRDCHVLATAGDVYLGGLDWDRRIAEFVAKEFLEKHRGIDPMQHPSGCHRLLREAEDAKRTLSARDSAKIVFEHAGEAIRVELTRAKFAELTLDLLERTRFTTTSVLRDAKLQWADISRLLLVGGSSRMPMVQDMLERESNQKVDRSLSFDEAVSHGAAIYAGALLQKRHGVNPGISIRNVNSHSLGVLGREPETGRLRTAVMIPRNSSLPIAKRTVFKTYRANQASVAVNIVEGGDASGNNATPIGKCVLRGLPAEVPAGFPVEVSFTYLENGRLMVSTKLTGVEKEASVTIERASGLSPAALHQWQKKFFDQGET